MQNLTSDIEEYILNLLDEEQEDFISLRRKELAEMFECVPSQINYVLRSRFSPEHGYLTESRRGGNGYIRIYRVTFDNQEEKLEHIDKIVGRTITAHEAHRLLEILQERELITQRERLLIEIALKQTNEILIDDYDFSPQKRNKAQAEALKRLLKGIMIA